MFGHNRWILISFVFLLGCLRVSAQDEPLANNATGPLPRLLILGDSISIGYTPRVRELLRGKVDVYRPADNCGPTTRGLQRLDAWLGEESWDVIHFNFGLHDLKHIDEKGQLVSPNQGAIQVPLPEYEANLERIVRRLQKTGAKLIWCTTTPVPPGATGRIPGDAAKYNAVADRVMCRCLGEGYPVNDLYEFVADKMAQLQQPANVHFTAEGSQRLAERVVEVVLKELNSHE